jgi:signal transduction histidine kinase
MNLPPPLSSRVQTERVIAAGRLTLAAASLFGVWWDPGEPTRAVGITYVLSGVYLAYSLALLGLVWSRPPGERLPIVSHVVDLIFVSFLQYLTLGPSSPFFLYFVFSLFCAVIRWDWKATLLTAGVVLGAYLLMTALIIPTLRPDEFDGERFVTRCVYVIVSSAILIYLSRHHERLRLEIDRLARWPQPTMLEMRESIAQLLSHAAKVVDAAYVVVIWEAGEEPYVLAAHWPIEGSLISRHPPGSLFPPVSLELEEKAFVAAGRVSMESELLVPNGKGGLVATSGQVRDEVLGLLKGEGLVSAPFRTERVSGRAFFMGFTSSASELVPLTEVVAREIGGSLNQLYIAEQMKEIAAGEERIRLARDLHDGVLQSLTGIRLEISAAVSALDGSPAARDRLSAIERALAIEQRELRRFISGLGPGRSSTGSVGSLASQLDWMKERIALEWKIPVTIRCEAERLPGDIERAVPLMVHEAIVNALKHGRPSQVAATVDATKDEVRIIVADDGHGFPFRGRHNHRALAESRVGPKSLLDRVAALGGEVWIESSDAGSRVEIVLSPLASVSAGQAG